MTSERSIQCLAWFATRSAAAAPEHPTKGSDDFLAQYQHEQLSRHGKSKQNAMCLDMDSYPSSSLL
jgi:hypothetical protein